jgi:hypothetical protein
MTTSGTGPDISAQGYETSHGKKLLLVNRRGFTQDAVIPADFADGTIRYVAASTNDNPPRTEKLQETTIHLQPFETAVVTSK